MAKTATREYKITREDSNLYNYAITWTGQACRVYSPFGQNLREVNTRIEDFYPGGVDGFITDYENDEIKPVR